MVEETTITTELTEEQIQAQMIAAVTAGSWSEVKRLAAMMDKLAKAEEATKKAELQKQLESLTADVKREFDKVATKLRESGKYDGADGFWYADDFGEQQTSCRIVKKQAKATGAVAGSGKSSYVADPRKSGEMLEVVGDTVMFAEDTTVTIDKEEHIMPAGTTLKDAYNYSTNGGWRNRVRMAIIKAMDKAS